MKKLTTTVRDVENKFNTLVKKSITDMPTALADNAKNQDWLGIEIIGNFNDLFKWCVERAATIKKPTPTVSTSRSAPSGV